MDEVPRSIAPAFVPSLDRRRRQTLDQGARLRGREGQEPGRNRGLRRIPDIARHSEQAQECQAVVCSFRRVHVAAGELYDFIIVAPEDPRGKPLWLFLYWGPAPLLVTGNGCACSPDSAMNSAAKENERAFLGARPRYKKRDTPGGHRRIPFLKTPLFKP